jgi:drug/metabolite transporter (DMT)-like permease
VLNPILVAFFYGETIGPISLVGAAIVLISSVVYQLRSTPAG